MLAPMGCMGDSIIVATAGAAAMSSGTVTTGTVGVTKLVVSSVEEKKVVAKDPNPIKGSSAVPSRGPTSVRPNTGSGKGESSRPVESVDTPKISFVMSTAIVGGPSINVAHRSH